MPKPALEMSWEYKEYEMLLQPEMPLKMGMRKARQRFSDDSLLNSSDCQARPQLVATVATVATLPTI